MTRRSKLLGWGVGAVTLLSLMVVANAQTAVTAVTITGDPVVGATLTANVTRIAPSGTVRYRWLRCSATTCTEIDTTAPSYQLSVADVGYRLAVRARDGGGGWVRSPFTQPVALAPPPTPTPTPTVEPTPTPTPTPGSDPVPPPAAPPSTFDQSGATPGAAPGGAIVAEPATSALRYLLPFPVVRVKGALATGGARIRLLRVRAPATAKVYARCWSGGCRVERRERGGGRIRALERFVRAGTRITIRVTRRGMIGKYVRLLVRDGKAPARRDACLLPGGSRPAKCPRA
jgi:hypothetical protein